jgi:hypothetical protein
MRADAGQSRREIEAVRVRPFLSQGQAAGSATFYTGYGLCASPSWLATGEASGRWWEVRWQTGAGPDPSLPSPSFSRRTERVGAIAPTGPMG